MPDLSARDLQPVATLRRAVLGGTIDYLRTRPTLHVLVGATGAVLLGIGIIAAPLWEVPLLSWLSAGQVAGVCLTGGLAAMGIWYLSRRTATKLPDPREQATTLSAQPIDLADQLRRLKELHASGALSDAEFERAKSRVLE